eukprot:gene8096-8964_t
MAYEMADAFIDRQDGDARDRKRLKQYKAIIAIVFFAFIVCLILFICSIFLDFGCPKKQASKKHSSASTLKFFHISDVHLDLYYDSKVNGKSFCRSMPNTLNITPVVAAFEAQYGRVGCDSPMKLIHSTLTYMKSLTKDKKNPVDVVLLTGDLSAHGMQKGFVNGTSQGRVLKAIEVLSEAFGQTFPDIPFVPLIGNNDLPGHYVLPTNKSYYESVLAIWKPLIVCEKCKLKVTTEAELRSTFLIGGYYKAEIKSANVVLLQLNTNYWSVTALSKSASPKIYEVADMQMKWLEEQLKACKAAGKKAITTGHIPPGIDGYSGKVFWRQNYTSKYIEMVTKTYKDVIIGQLYGHIHKDNIRVQSATDKMTSKDLSFILTAPGITPIFNNNPGFRVVSLDTKRQVLTDYEQHYMDLVLTTREYFQVFSEPHF